MQIRLRLVGFCRAFVFVALIGFFFWYLNLCGLKGKNEKPILIRFNRHLLYDILRLSAASSLQPKHTDLNTVTSSASLISSLFLAFTCLTHHSYSWAFNHPHRIPEKPTGSTSINTTTLNHEKRNYNNFTRIVCPANPLRRWWVPTSSLLILNWRCSNTAEVRLLRFWGG